MKIKRKYMQDNFYSYEELIENFAPHSQDSYNLLFYKAEQACASGDMKLLRSIVLCHQIDINLEKTPTFLQMACEYDQVEIAKFLLTSTELKTHCHIHWVSDTPLLTCCKHGSLKVAKFLLTSPELHDHANLRKDEINHIFNPFFTACSWGHQSMVEFLLTDPQINEFSSFRNMFETFHNTWNTLFNPLKKIPKGLNFNKKQILEGAVSAAIGQQIEVFKYLTTLPQLTLEDLQAHDNALFRKSCKKLNVDIMNFMINELKIKLDDSSWKKLRQDFGESASSPLTSLNSQKLQTIQDMFESIHFSNHLEHVLIKHPDENLQKKKL